MSFSFGCNLSGIRSPRRVSGKPIERQTMLETYLKMLDLVYFEVPFAFEGLSDENVWKRPAPRLLSVGELAGHIAYWEAIKFADAGGAEEHPDLTRCAVRSLLIDHRFRYHTTTLAMSPSDEHRAMTAEKVCQELLRIHGENRTYFLAQSHDLTRPVPGYPPQFTYEELLKYNIFHVSYHTGQMYTVRHLFGEETPDN
ncbi:MAG: hypothetical protein OHK0029_20000 [Armatimonadaceae bacterium]